ncbi:MAG: MotA/TolQ/ExbB proton channel family protein [Kiritimatiellae bacterium]|nr:MotA/TolQ/ExbB proton channel family protein [Kiritimatiellia bacterium]
MNVWTFAGGPVFWLLAAMLVAAVAIFLVRLLELRRAHIDYVDFIHGVGNLLSGGRVDEALALCDDTAVPVTRVVAAAIRRRADSARALREAIDTSGRVEVGRIARRFAALAIIAQTAPLIGLMGTFFGGIHAVNALNAAALVSRGDLLAGLMEALVSAAAGLLVGIPAQVMYGVLRVRFERLVIELEAAASEVLMLLTTHRTGVS